MQDGDFQGSGTVTEAAPWRVYVNGVYRHHESATLDAEIASDLPDQVAGVSGIVARTGTVVFAPVETVSDEPASPLRRTGDWPPRRGDELDIYAVTATQRWKVATARVVESSAPLGDGRVTVKWSDDLDSTLSTPTTLPPIAEEMPGTEVLESGIAKRYWMSTGVEPWALWVEALEDAGYRILPSPSAGTGNQALYALFQGTAYPRVGFIQQTYSVADLLAWDTTSGFQYLNQWSYFTPSYNQRDPGDDLQIFLRTTKGGPSAQLRFTVSATEEIRIVLSGASSSVQVIYYRTDTSTSTVIAQQGFTTDSPLPWVGISIGPDVTNLWTADDAYRQFWHADKGAPTALPLDWSRVRAYGAAAVMVKFGTRSGWNSFNWPSLRFRSTGPWLVREPTCTRTIEAKTVKSVLEEIAKATLTGFWLDEHGIMQVAPSSVLEGRAPVETITTRADVLAGSWQETPGGVAGSVVVEYEAAVLTKASQVRVTVSESTGSTTLLQGDARGEFVGPDEDEEWIEPDMSPLSAAQSAEVSMKRGLFSMWGGSYVSTEGVDENGNPEPDSTTYGWAQSEGWLSITVDPLSPRQWKVIHNVGSNSAGVNPPGEIQLLVLPGLGTRVPVEWRGRPLPIWRARGKAQYTDASEVSNLGPSWAPTYTHDLGAWGNAADARRVADWLGARMAAIQVILTELEVMHDPRRQLGDVVDVKADGVLGGTLRGLIVGIHATSAADRVTQKLDIRVISTTALPRLTYEQVEAAATYQVHEDKPTYETIENGG